MESNEKTTDNEWAKQLEENRPEKSPQTKREQVVSSNQRRAIFGGNDGRNN